MGDSLGLVVMDQTEHKIMAKQNGNIDEDNKTEKEIKKKFWS